MTMREKMAEEIHTALFVNGPLHYGKRVSWAKANVVIRNISYVAADAAIRAAKEGK